SDVTKAVIGEFHAATVWTLDLAVDAVQNGNVESAEQANAMKEEINALAEAAALHQARRLVAEEPNRVSAYKLETDVAEHLKRVYYFTKRTARAVLPILERSAT
ncbi:MAG: Na/Pi cotransporter family protein, partial [Acidimicrobiia bacterium]|nr:Na/Pi cotransporter family protein [Acidimicrobiia bacterium]